MLAPSVRSSYQPPAPKQLRTDIAIGKLEKEVLELLCQGKTNDQIATELHRSVSSVKQVLAKLSRRAGVHSRTGLVLYVLDGPS